MQLCRIGLALDDFHDEPMGEADDLLADALDGIVLDADLVAAVRPLDLNPLFRSDKEWVETKDGFYRADRSTSTVPPEMRTVLLPRWASSPEPVPGVSTV